MYTILKCIFIRNSIIPRDCEIEFTSIFSRRNEVSWYGESTLDRERRIKIEKVIFGGQDFTEYAYVSTYVHNTLEPDNEQLLSHVERMARFIDERNCQIAKLLIDEKEEYHVKVTLYLAKEEYRERGSVPWNTP